MKHVPLCCYFQQRRGRRRRHCSTRAARGRTRSQPHSRRWLPSLIQDKGSGRGWVAAPCVRLRHTQRGVAAIGHDDKELVRDSRRRRLGFTPQGELRAGTSRLRQKRGSGEQARKRNRQPHEPSRDPAHHPLSLGALTVGKSLSPAAQTRRAQCPRSPPSTAVASGRPAHSSVQSCTPARPHRRPAHATVPPSAQPRPGPY